MTVGGHDPSGGAGVAADLRTFAACGVHGVSVLTVVTAQSSVAFRSATGLPPGVVLAQFESVTEDLAVGAVKTGMLWSHPVAVAMATLARLGQLPRLVCDPVIANWQGQRILDVAVDAVYRDELFPAATVVTPNTVEAGLLLNAEIGTVDEAADAALLLADLGPEAVVVTGGRLPGAESVDVVVVGGSVEVLRSERVDTVNVRGSGDTLSAAVAAELARGSAVPEAIRAAHAFTAAALRRSASWRLGSGQGPLDQLGIAGS
jgi:hydroxymethylpyrimidine/phosphomethylpyrimidine kinase